MADAAERDAELKRLKIYRRKADDADDEDEVLGTVCCRFSFACVDLSRSV